MALKKTIAQQIFYLSRFSTPTLHRNTLAKPELHLPNPTRPDQTPYPTRHPLHQSASTESTLPYPATMRLFPMTRPEPKRVLNSEAREVLRATRTKNVKEKLRDEGREWVMCEEFVEMIQEFCGGDKNEALYLVKILDESGGVIVMANYVFLHPHKVAKAIHSLVAPPMSTDCNDPRREELEQMEEQKAEIDRKADALVRRELWLGLGYMVVQTVAFMRLTFWELSWDVMEPICFYVTSIYFMLGYTFFIRTSKEPSFEGFFKSRFNAKQKRLMKALEFNLERYNELRKVLNPRTQASLFSVADSKLIKYGGSHHGN